MNPAHFLSPSLCFTAFKRSTHPFSTILTTISRVTEFIAVLLGCRPQPPGTNTLPTVDYLPKCCCKNLIANTFASDADALSNFGLLGLAKA